MSKVQITNAKLVSWLTTGGTAIVAFLFTAVFHTHIPQDIDYVIPIAAAGLANLGITKFLASKAVVTEEDVVAEAKKLENVFSNYLKDKA